MRPLYMWAGGKTKMIAKYLQSPGIPGNNYTTFVEPFFGGGAMSLWIYENCPTVERFIINDVKEEIVGIYLAIKSDLQQFLLSLDALQSDYLQLDKVERKAFYYALRQQYTTDWKQWSGTKESAVLYFLMKTGFNGIWQTNKSSNGRFATPCGLLGQKTEVYDLQTVLDWNQFLQQVDIKCGDWFTACPTTTNGVFYFMDPPYRNSFTNYGEGFSELDHIRLIDFCKSEDLKGNIVFYCNRNTSDNFYINNKGQLDISTYDIVYTAGRRKVEESGAFTAKKAEEILLHSKIAANNANTTSSFTPWPRR